MSTTAEERIAREEEYWTAPRLLALGVVFLGTCILVIIGMSNI